MMLFLFEEKYFEEEKYDFHDTVIYRPIARQRLYKTFPRREILDKQPTAR
jgi:hypothetical protein